MVFIQSSEGRLTIPIVGATLPLRLTLAMNNWWIGLILYLNIIRAVGKSRPKDFHIFFHHCWCCSGSCSGSRVPLAVSGEPCRVSPFSILEFMADDSFSSLLFLLFVATGSLLDELLSCFPGIRFSMTSAPQIWVWCQKTWVNNVRSTWKGQRIFIGKTSVKLALTCHYLERIVSLLWRL